MNSIIFAAVTSNNAAGGQHWRLVVVLLVLAGLLCGVAKFLQMYGNQKVGIWKIFTGNFTQLLRELSQSLVAAMLTPLLLNTLSSDLVSQAMGDSSGTPDNGSLLILFGFALIAAWTGTNLINLLSDKLLLPLQKEVEDTKAELQNLKQETQPMIDRRTEPDVRSRSLTAKAPLTRGLHEPLSNQQKILAAMHGSQFDFRSLAGITKDAELEEPVVLRELEELQARGLVGVRKSKGQQAWYLKDSGNQED